MQCFVPAPARVPAGVPMKSQLPLWITLKDKLGLWLATHVFQVRAAHERVHGACVLPLRARSSDARAHHARTSRTPHAAARRLQAWSHLWASWPCHMT